jgi:hypothetical protein
MTAYIGTEPNVYEQAKERARDDLTRRELTNMLYDFPGVHECLVDHEDDPTLPTTITVGFDDEGYRDTSEVATVMQRAGWKLDRVVFSPYNRVSFVERTSEVSH